MPVVRILQTAAEEAAEGAAWYESQRPGLGIEFESALRAALDLLETPMTPLVALPGRAGDRGAMRIVMRRFPFDVVVIRPGYWRERIHRRT